MHMAAIGVQRSETKKKLPFQKVVNNHFWCSTIWVPLRDYLGRILSDLYSCDLEYKSPMNE